MDDVDRLYQCFKCGVSPPESALRERKKSKGKISKVNVTQGEGSLFGSCSSKYPRDQQRSPVDIQLQKEQLGTAEIKVTKFSKKKQISPVVFYGSPHGVPAKRPSSLLRLLREIHRDLHQDDTLSSRKDIWVTFPKQDQAMSFATKYPHARLFSYQDHLSGQRRFLVSTYKEFWRRYINMDSRLRHHYEVIQEGLPCHLYFDLEFNKKVNADKNGDEMVVVLLSLVFDLLFDKYSIQGNEDWVLELDSSTEEKFSRHLIIHVPNAAFKDNSHAGAFVSEICSRICIAKETDHRLGNLLVAKDSRSHESPRQLFVDTAVYSRNRVFRLALSSKAGKSSVLLPTKRFRKNMCEEEMFMDSLICKMDDDCTKLLICKMDIDCMKKLYFDSEVHCRSGQGSNGPGLSFNASTTNVGNTYLIGKSPFPALDVFVESIASIGNVSGKIRSWYWFSEYGLIVYNMSKNKYCERIGRQHKSNNVMYIVDFKMAAYYQKCYDPECKGYRSPFRPLPRDVIPDTVDPFNLTQAVHHEGGNNEHDHQFNKNGKEQSIDDDNYENDDWWLNAIKVADDIECGAKSVDHAKPQVTELSMVDDEDYEWWTSVEKTASQAEQQSVMFYER